MSDAREIWLYGSRARGDGDERSDTDVLVVSDDPVVASIPIPGVEGPVVVSLYNWSEVEGMWSYGSLFLAHIATEGLRLQPSPTEPERLPTLLDTLPPFSRARHDLNSFHAAVRDGGASLAHGGWPDLELQVLGTVARHAAILGCHCIGRPTFSREEPFVVVGAPLGQHDGDTSGFASLATAFRYTPLGDPAWTALEEQAKSWLQAMERFLKMLEVIVERYEAALPQAA